MSNLHRLYQQLRSVSDTSVDLAMAAALPTADPLAKQLIGLTLLARNHTAGVVAMIHHFHDLDADLQQAVIDRVPDLYGAMRQAVDGNNEQTRLNVIEIVARARRPRLAYLVTDQLRRSGAELHKAASTCLLELAWWACTHPRKSMRSDEAGRESREVRSPADAKAAAFLETAIAAGVESFGVHQQTRVLLALSYLTPRPLADARRLLEDARHPAVTALRNLLRESHEAPVRRSLLWFAQIPTLTDAAFAGVRTSVARGLTGDLVTGAHLTVDRRLTALMADLHRPEELVHSDNRSEAFGTSQVADLPPQDCRHLPQWIMALPLAPEQKVRELASLDSVPDAPARLSALRQLMVLSENEQAVGALSAVADFCYDPNPQLARIAIRHLIRKRWDGLVRLLLKLTNATHPDIRAVASAELAPLGFERLWSAWPRLSFAQQTAAGRALIKLDPGFHRHVSVRLNQPDSETRMRAITIIRRLNQGELFEEALSTLIQDQDPRIASAAVQALGTGGGNRAVKAVQDALEHANSRVRANAIEALHEMNSTEHIELLTQMAKQDANRPRANAIGVLLNLDIEQALHLLVRMLDDTRPEHRISALWLVDHLELVQVARQVAEASISDPDSGVKERASGVIQGLISAISPDEAPPESVPAKGASK